MALGLETESGETSRLLVVPRQEKNVRFLEIVSGTRERIGGDGWERFMRPFLKAWPRGVHGVGGERGGKLRG